MMPPIKDNKPRSVLLEQFQLGDQKISFRAYAGGGRAGYVFQSSHWREGLCVKDPKLNGMDL